MSDRDDDMPQPPAEVADAAEVQRFLEEVLVHYILRVDVGEAPDIDQYLARYPRFAEDLAVLMSQESAPSSGLRRATTTTTRDRVRGWSMNTIGEYEILFHVSSAGGGHVYKARHSPTGRDVALKVLSAKESVDARELERFKREARLLSETAIEHVIPVIELAELKGILYMAMPWIEGMTLQEAIAVLAGGSTKARIDPATLTIAARVAIIAVVARTLDRVHARGILHRDIKPSNVMLDTALSPTLIDFGIARDADAHPLTNTHDAPLGTPRFLAPELLLGDAKAATVRTEIYALGVTLHEFLTLRPAFDAADRRTLYTAIRDGAIVAPHDVNRAIPRSLSRIVMKAVSTSPAGRFASAAEFASRLEKWIEDSGRRRGLLARLLARLRD